MSNANHSLVSQYWNNWSLWRVQGDSIIHFMKECLSPEVFCKSSAQDCAVVRLLFPQFHQGVSKCERCAISYQYPSSYCIKSAFLARFDYRWEGLLSVSLGNCVRVFLVCCSCYCSYEFVIPTCRHFTDILPPSWSEFIQIVLLGLNPSCILPGLKYFQYHVSHTFSYKMLRVALKGHLFTCIFDLMAVWSHSQQSLSFDWYGKWANSVHTLIQLCFV